MREGEEGKDCMQLLDKYYTEKFPVPSLVSSAASSLPRCNPSLQGRTNLGEAQRPSRFPTTGLNLIQAKQFSILKKHRKMRSQTSADLQTFVASSWWCKQAQVQALGHFWSLQDFPLGAEHIPSQVS